MAGSGNTDLKKLLAKKSVELQSAGNRNTQADPDAPHPKDRGQLFWILEEGRKKKNSRRRKLKGLFGGGED